MSARIFLALFVVGAILESVCGSPYKHREPPPIVTDDVADDEFNERLGSPPKPAVQEDEDKDVIVIDDMRMKRHQFHDDPKTRQKRMPWSNDYKWPKSGSTVTVPYTTSGVNVDVVKRAAEVFKSKTCIRLVPRNGEANYLAFQSGSTCQAQIGCSKSGAQAVQLTSGCAGSKGKVMHEVMHSLGFIHEQCRPDRNSYVTINTNNIKSGAENNFAIQAEYVNQNIPYDCDSILHYKKNAFSSNGQDTITSSHCSTGGNGDKRLSLLDYKRINTFYGCYDPIPTYVYFTVRVVTHSSYGSGTNCYIYLKLHGASGTSSEFELDLDDAGSSDLFESGSDDTFSKMAYRNNLGSITGISVRLVDNGDLFGAAWWPTTFTVTDPVSSQTKTFTNNQWLNKDNTYGTSDFTLQT